MIGFLLTAAVGLVMIWYGDRHSMRNWLMGSWLVFGGVLVFLVGIIGALVAL